jgi:molybdate transport system substrate-binding protein
MTQTASLLMFFAAAAIATAIPRYATAAEITLIGPGGIRTSATALIPGFEKASGHTVKATFGSGGGTKARVIKGDPFDVPIVQPPLEPVIASGHVIKDSETPLAVAPIAVAVRTGATKPDISTADSVKRMLLAAKSITYPNVEGSAAGGAAGVSINETLAKLGIAEAMRPKTRPAETGFATARMVAAGEAEIGLVFLSEMIHEPGITIVGLLPREISTPTGLVGFVSAHAREPAAARALLDYLSGPEAAKVYRDTGMVPGR